MVRHPERDRRRRLSGASDQVAAALSAAASRVSSRSGEEAEDDLLLARHVRAQAGDVIYSQCSVPPSSFEGRRATLISAIISRLESSFERCRSGGRDARPESAPDMIRSDAIRAQRPRPGSAGRPDAGRQAQCRSGAPGVDTFNYQPTINEQSRFRASDASGPTRFARAGRLYGGQFPAPAHQLRSEREQSSAGPLFAY